MPKKDLGRHTREVHEKIKNHACNIFCKAFSRAVHLSDHLKYEHLKPNEKLNCDICGEHFSQNGFLKLHIERKHEGKLRHFCHICDKRFQAKKALSEHISSIHEYTKKYKCDICHDAFSHKHTLRNHLKSAHGEALKCHKCDKTFTDRKNFINHNIIAHEII